MKYIFLKKALSKEKKKKESSGYLESWIWVANVRLFVAK